MTDGALRKVRKPYLNAPSATVQDNRLSFRARGVLLYLLDKPDGWRVRAESIVADGQEGRDAIRSALRELAENGYYRRTKTRGEDGHWVTVTEVSDTAVQEWVGAGTEVEDVSAGHTENGFPGVGNPTPGFPTPGFPTVGNPKVGKPGPVFTTENHHSEGPPTPTAPRQGPSCRRHKDKPGTNCRFCRTTARTVHEDTQPKRPPKAPWCGDEWCDPHSRFRERINPDTGRPVAGKCPECHPDMTGARAEPRSEARVG